MKSKSKQNGFTLIELLVVISIVGLLSSIVLASLKSAREKAQIAKFKQEMNSLRSALELYKSDNGFYPKPDRDEVNLQVLTNDFLYNYIKNVPNVPVSLHDGEPIYSHRDIYLTKWSVETVNCGNLSGNEGYIIYFKPKSAIASQFPILFNDGENSHPWYCAFTPPK